MTFQDSEKRRISTVFKILSTLIVSSLLSSVAFAATATAKIPHKTWRNSVETTYPTDAGLGTLSTALRFVLVTGLHKNLSLLLLHDVKNQQPVQNVVKQHGMDKAQDAVVKAIRIAKNTHAAEWNEMLAGVYKLHFTDDELLSIMTDRETSPYFKDLIAKQSLIAAETKTRGQSIFAEAKANVLNRISEADL